MLAMMMINHCTRVNGAGTLEVEVELVLLMGRKRDARTLAGIQVSAK